MLRDLHDFVCNYIVGYPTIFKMDKILIWIVRLLFWVVEKQSTSMSVVNTFLWWCCCAVDAKPWNNRVCQHSVLSYLSTHKQYRMCILRTRRCSCPISRYPMPTYINCHVSLVCNPYLEYCAYSYTEWPM